MSGRYYRAQTATGMEVIVAIEQDAECELCVIRFNGSELFGKFGYESAVTDAQEHVARRFGAITSWEHWPFDGGYPCW